MGDFGLVREALRERELLLTRIAPHLVAPVPFLWPLRGRGWERAYLGAGLALYDTHRRRALGAAPPAPEPPRRAARRRPRCAPDALVGAVQFHDAAEDDARMVAVVARTAAAHGAHIATRVRVDRLPAAPGEVEAVDEETGETLVLRARHVAGAAGAWTDRLRELAGGRSSRRIVPSKGIHVFVAARPHPDGDRAARADGEERAVRHPVAGRLADRRHRHAVDGGARPARRHRRRRRLPAREDERAARRAAAARGRPRRHRRACGRSSPTAARRDTTRISRKHVVESPAPGLTTIAGGKYTTYRVMAADLVDAAAARSGPGAVGDARRPLLGAGVDARRSRRAASAAGRRPGAPLRRRAAELVALIEARPELAEPLEGGGGHLRAEVVHACTHEGALHLEDVLERRTRLALTAPDRGLAAAAPAAALMAGALGWDAGAHAPRGRGAGTRASRPARAAEAERDDERARSRALPRRCSPSGSTPRCAR